MRLNFRRASTYGVMLIFAQGSAALAGLLLARHLTVPEYALYSVFIVMMGAANIISSGSVVLILNSKIGECWGDFEKIPPVFYYARKIQTSVSLATMPVIIIFSSYLFSKNGASLLLICILVILMLAAWIAEQSTRLDVQILQFDGKQAWLQTLEFSVSVCRLILISTLLLSDILDIRAAIIVYLISVLPKIYFIKRAKRKYFAIVGSGASAKSKKDMRDFVKRHILNDVFLCIQPQVALFAASILGGVKVTAGLGALTRISQLSGPFVVAFMAFAIPYFSKKTDKLLSTYVKLSVFGVFPGLIIAACSWFYPDALLYLIGPNYEQLVNELRILALSILISSWLGMSWQLLLNRGHNKYAWANVPSSIVLTCVGLFLFDITSLEGLLKLQAVAACSPLLPITMEFIFGDVRDSWG